MEVGGGGYEVPAAGELEEGCLTPRHSGCRIPAAPKVCPPAPRKGSRPQVYRKPMRDLPKNGYFHPPDLELVFSFVPRAN